MRSGFWKKLRVAFRWCRIAVWLAVLAVICALLWCNLIGLPGFLTERIVETLRSRGIELQFTRMRLHFIGGIIAENVRVGDVRMTNSPTLSFAQVRLPLNFAALLRRRVEIDGVTLRQGKLIWPVSSTNALTVENIQTDVRFQPEDTWTLDRFNARFVGVRFTLSGEIAHAPDLRKLFRGKKTTGQSAFQQRLQNFSDELAQIHFEGEPRIRLDIKGDARKAGSFVARLNVVAPAARTPWGNGHDVQLAARFAAPGASTNLNRAWDWWTNMHTSVELVGVLRMTNGAVFDVPLDSFHTHFSYTNMVWQLPDLQILQAGTHLEISADENDATKNFHTRIRGLFNPEMLRPLLKTTNEIRIGNRFQFSKPIALDVTAGGFANDLDSIGATGSLAATNFAVRKQAIETIAGDFVLTNRVLTFLHPVMFRKNGAQTMTADTITLNFPAKLILFTNGFSTADPVSFIRTIGPKTARIVEPYIQFLTPPTVRVEGCVPLRDINGGHDLDDADLTFKILKGAPYRVKKFHATNVVGTVRWLGQSLILSNINAELYSGFGKGHATFDFRPRTHVADYEFNIRVSDINIHQLMADVSSHTNKLEGTLFGQIVVTNGDTKSLMSWNGYGGASLRNGLIWDEPVFGFLSPVLNAVYPGLGNSRAREATATFGLTNGVIFTDSLEIRSMLVRLNYSGTVDMDENLDAQVNGQLLRDVWGLGPVVSTVLWPMSKLFEYHVTGTLSHPKSEPIYVPKFLLMPLHPIKTIEGILPGGEIFTNSTSETPND